MALEGHGPSKEMADKRIIATGHVACWPHEGKWRHCLGCCLVQCSRTNKMHFLFLVYHELTASACFDHYLLIIRRRYENGIWYTACVCQLQSCGTVEVSLQLTLYACSIPNAVCVSRTEDEQVMLETCRGHCFSINWMKCASRWFHYIDVLCCTVRQTLSLVSTA
jgi:hypothetical protein